MRLAFKWASPALGLDYTQNRFGSDFDSKERMSYRNILRTQYAHGKLDKSRPCAHCGDMIKLEDNQDKSDAIIVFCYTRENQDIYQIVTYHHQCHYRHPDVDMPFDELNTPYLRTDNLGSIRKKNPDHR